MTQAFNRIAYAYDERTTLRSLMAEFLNANPGALDAAANVLGVKAETLGQWVEGTWTEGLRTRYFHAFVQMTGIDLDRLMMIEAKRRIWERDPGTRAFVTLDRFQTRSDLVKEIGRIKALPSYDGVRLLAWQIGINDHSVNNWLNGRELPSNDNLEPVILSLSRGVMESGSRNDLAFRVAVQRVCGQEPERCLGLSSFQELVNSVFTPALRARGDTIASQQAGINRSTTVQLLRWKPTDDKTFPYGTLFSLVRIHVRSRWDDPTRERFDRIVAEFLNTRNTTYEVKETVFANADVPARPAREQPPNAAPAPEPPRRAQPSPVQADGRKAPVPITLDGGIRRLVSHLRTQLLQAAMDFPDVVRRLPLIPGLEIGETLHNVRWCLTGANMPDVGDWDPSDQEIELIAEAVALVRRAVLLVLGLPMPVRRRVIKRLARELDELFLAFDHAGVEDLVGFAEQIGLQRKQADIVREGKR